MDSENLKLLLDQLAVKRLRMENIVDEVVTSGLYPDEQIVIAPERSSSYFYERDVAEIEEVFNQTNSSSWVKVNIPRDGLYESLPERLFHRPTKRGQNNEQWDEIRTEEIKQEQEARQFFLPFDNAVNHQHVRIAQFEKQVLLGQEKAFLNAFLSIFWPNTASLELTENQRLILLQITLIAHKVAGNIKHLQDCFEQMLDDKITMFYENVTFNLPIETAFAPLGKALMGVDAILHCQSFRKWRRLKIQIGPLSYEQMSKYFPNQKGEKLFQFMCNLLLPVEVDWVWELVPKVKMDSKEDQEDNQVTDMIQETVISFNLHPKQQAVLGYSTILG